MKKREFQQLKSKPKAELLSQLTALREKSWGLKKDLVAGKVKNVREIRVTKKDTAKILTILNNQQGPR